MHELICRVELGMHHGVVVGTGEGAISERKSLKIDIVDFSGLSQQRDIVAGQESVDGLEFGTVVRFRGVKHLEGV